VSSERLSHDLLANDQTIEHFEKLKTSIIKALWGGKLEQAYKICVQFVNEFQELELDDNLVYKSFEDYVEWATAMVEWMDSGWPVKLSNFADLRWLPIPIAKVYFFMGYILHETEDFDDAIRLLNDAIFWNPVRAQYFCELAAIYTKDQNSMGLAFEYYKKALENAWDTHGLAAGYRGVGFCLIEMNDLEGAKAAYKKSLLLEPDSELAHNQLQYIDLLDSEPLTPKTVTSGPRHYQVSGLPLKDLPEIEPAVIEIDPQALSATDLLLLERNIPITVNPKFADGFTVLGLMALDDGDVEQALDIFKHARLSNDKSAAVHEGLAEVYTQMGEDKLAKYHRDMSAKLEAEME